jgi:hypothetical protein
MLLQTCLTKLFKFKKISIKQAILINEILSFQVEGHKQKKIEVFFAVFLRFLLLFARFSAFFKISKF